MNRDCSPPQSHHSRIKFVVHLYAWKKYCGSLKQARHSSPSILQLLSYNAPFRSTWYIYIYTNKIYIISPCAFAVLTSEWAVSFCRSCWMVSIGSECTLWCPWSPWDYHLGKIFQVDDVFQELFGQDPTTKIALCEVYNMLSVPYTHTTNLQLALKYMFCWYVVSRPLKTFVYCVSFTRTLDTASMTSGVTWLSLILLMTWWWIPERAIS